MAPRALFAAATAATILLSQAVSAHMFECPTKEVCWTTPEGTRYNICDNSDHRHGGSSLEIHECVTSTQECLKLCHKHPKCEKAVFHKTHRVCHIKNNDNVAHMDWSPDAGFDVIRRDYGDGLTDGDRITICPNTGTGYKTRSGALITACVKTDYTGPNAETIRNIADAHACADTCTSKKSCKKAVYDTVDKICYIKDTSKDLQWVSSERFVAIDADSDPRNDSGKGDSNTDPPKGGSVATLGQWSEVIQLPLIPVAAYIVPAYPEPERMLMFSSWGKDAFGGASGKTQFGDFNFKTGAISEREVVDTRHDMFCPGMSQMQDGRIVISGGSDAEAVSIYNPETNQFTRGPNMKIARGYQTSTILSDGRIFTIGGAFSGSIEAKNGEVFDPATQEWTYLPDADVKPMLTTDREGVWREDNHSWLFGWKNGSVFQAGPSKDQHWYGAEGTGRMMKAGTRDTVAHAMCGVWVMYDAMAGKILSAGGSPEYTNSDANARSHITTIGEPWEPSQVERVGDMAAPRGFANAVVLPDGQVLVTGGQRKSMVFTNTGGVLEAELFNPETKQWTQLASQAVPRNYHSVSILLPDGTVFSGGGGLCPVGTPDASSAGCDKTVDHADGEIFSPPYLFNADGSKATRPVISGLAQESVSAGATLTFTVDSAVKSLSMIRTGSVTHSVNSDQRRIPLADFESNNGQFAVKLPTDSGILLPGYYYLFAISPSGTPSLAKSVHVVL